MNGLIQLFQIILFVLLLCPVPGAVGVGVDVGQEEAQLVAGTPDSPVQLYLTENPLFIVPGNEVQARSLSEYVDSAKLIYCWHCVCKGIIPGLSGTKHFRMALSCPTCYAGRGQLVLRDVHLTADRQLQLFAGFASFADAMVMPYLALVNGSGASVSLERVELQTTCSQVLALQNLMCSTLVNTTLIGMEVSHATHQPC